MSGASRKFIFAEFRENEKFYFRGIPPRSRSYSPLTFVGGETSTAEFTPPRNFRLPAAIVRGKCRVFCSSKLLRLISPPTNVRGEADILFSRNFARMKNFIFGGIPPRSRFLLAPDICRGRNKYGGVYSAPQFPLSRRNLSFAKNAGVCSSKLLRLISPPTNVRGES